MGEELNLNFFIQLKLTIWNFCCLGSLKTKQKTFTVLCETGQTEQLDNSCCLAAQRRPTQ